MSHIRTSFVRTIVSVVVAGLGTAAPSGARAQQPPRIQPPQPERLPPSRGTTAAEYARAVRLYQVQGLVTDDGQSIVPDNQRDTVLSERTHRWVASLQNAPVVGIQLDPSGTLSVVVGKDAVAKQQFATRLATPSLSLDDRAYTLLTAVKAFATDASDRARMQIAHQYAAVLDSMPVAVISRQFYAHGHLGRVYYDAGDTQHAIAELSATMAIVPKIPFLKRRWWGAHEINEYYLLFADVLSGQPNGRARIDTLDALLVEAARAPQSLLQHDRDSIYFGLDISTREAFETIRRTTQLRRNTGGTRLRQHALAFPINHSATV
jgi:hypothetical protein